MIESVTATVPGASIPSIARQVGNQTLSKDDFLRLLMTQLQHQDPLNPLDQNQFLTQTAQFTSLEQLQNINQALDNLTTATASSGVAQAAALLGKTVKVAGSDFALGVTGSASLPFTVEGAATPVQVAILDQQGNALKTFDVNPGQAGNFTATWDGLDSAGQSVAPGRYYYRVSALSDGSSQSVVTAGQGVLFGLQVNGGAVRYRLGTTLVRPEDVIDVRS